MYKKAKYLILLAIVAASSIISAINLPQTASAATANLYLAPEIKTDAKQSGLRVSLALCLEIYRGGNLNGDPPFQTSASNIANGDWFQDNDEPQVRAGYLIDPDNGQVECRNLFKGRNVAKDLGFASNIELACAIKLSRMNDSNCENGSGAFTSDTTSKDKIYNAIDAKTKGNGFNTTQYYVMAANTYLTACGGKAVVNWSDASIDQKNSDNFDRIKVVTGTGKIVEVLYSKKNNGGKAFRNDEGDFHFINENCDWMKDRMNEYAGKYAEWVSAHKAADGDNAGPGTSTDSDEEAEESTCAVPGVGWIICPIINSLLAPVVDAAYGYVASLLTIQPLSATPEDGDPLYSAWSAMRDFANVAFVIAFLIIVFSQLTSIGVNNYGIKKMLPRLVIAAILVNVSYWLCAIAVDLSNIAGASMRGIFQGVTNNLAAPDYSGSETGKGAAGWVGLSAALLVTTGVALYIGLSALIPALIIVLFTILAVFITLAIRQALVILLIVVAPLAFVAYLLPNTESLFTKWRKLFTTLLILYPIVGIIFGASELASKIVTDAAPTGNDVNDGYTMAFRIMGGMIAVVPLVVVPTMVKGTKALGNVIGGRMGNVLNDPNKGPFDRARKGAEGYRKNREQLRDARALNDGSYRFGQSIKKRGARRQAVLAQRERNARNAQTSYVANAALSDDVSLSQRALSTATRGRMGGNTEGEQLLGQMAKGGGEGGQNAALAQAISQQASIRADEIKASSAVLDHLDVGEADTRALARGESVAGLNGQSEAVRAAAMQRVANTGDVEGMNQLINGMSQMNRTAQQDLVDALSNSKEKPSYLSAGVLAGLRSGQAPELNAANRDSDATGNKISVSDQLIVNAINNSTYSPSKLVTASKDELKAVADVASNAAIASNRDELGNAAATAAGDSRLANQIGKNRKEFERIQSLAPPTPPTPGTP